ncbi:MAG TPA: DUF4350 domain-containing protein [Anaeromyxobacter sp.]|nr:DUF4350 domain-containing protein [Anaeromyxobacter sp.]
MKVWGALVAAAALGLLAAGTILLQARRGPPPTALRSAANPGRAGLAAGHELLRAGGAAVRTRAPGEAPARAPAVVILAAPAAPIGRADAAELVAAAEAGATVVVALGEVPQPALLDALGVAFTPGEAPRAARGLAPHPLVGDLELSARSARVAPARPGPLAVSGDDAGASAVSVPAGRGEVLVLSGAEPLENARLLEPGALTLWTRLGRRARDAAGPVVFDERFLAPTAASAPASPPSRRALALLAGQLLAAGAALVWARGRRLGAVRPAPAPPGDRTARAYLASLAALYRRAGAEAELAAQAWRALRRRLERRYGVPARLPDAEAARRLGARSAAAALALARGSAALAAGGPGVLLRVTRAAADAEAALGGGASARSR